MAECNERGVPPTPQFADPVQKRASLPLMLYQENEKNRKNWKTHMTMPIIDQNAKLNSPTGNKREENKQKEQKQHRQAELPLTFLASSNRSKTQKSM